MGFACVVFRVNLLVARLPIRALRGFLGAFWRKFNVALPKFGRATLNFLRKSAFGGKSVILLFTRLSTFSFFRSGRSEILIFRKMENFENWTMTATF